MKNLSSALACCILFAASCNETANNQKTTGNADSIAVQPVSAAPETKTLCFAQQNVNDTFRLSIKAEGSRATGTLSYIFKEKDSNRGEISGSISGDTLIADYTFNAEGVSSVRQVAFLIQGDKATEGYADLEQKDGKMVFKDISKISFGKGIVMTKTDCR